MRSLSTCALTALLLGAAGPAVAAEPDLDDFDDRLHRAEAAVEGVVESVRFVSSQRDAEGPGVPHTFVTYRVEHVFKGRVRGNTLTLRFLGGLDPTGDELLVTSDGVEVDVGDRDILLVAGNGDAECPLVDCAYGRYRIIGDGVYDEGGRDVVLQGGDTPRRGQVRNLSEVFTWVATGLAIAFDEPPPPPEPGAAVSPTDFREFIATRVKKTYTPEELLRLPIVRSVDPAEPFFFRHPVAVSPPFR